MSRSYKKTPVLKDSNTSKKTSKRMANKIVRKTDFDVLTSIFMIIVYMTLKNDGRGNRNDLFYE